MSDEIPTLDLLLRELKYEKDPEKIEKLKKRIALERMKEKGWGRNKNKKRHE